MSTTQGHPSTKERDRHTEKKKTRQKKKGETQEKESQRHTKQGNKSYTKTPHNTDKDQKLLWFSPCQSGRETDRNRPSEGTNHTQKHCTTLTKTSGYLDSLHVNQEGRETETDQVREQILNKNTAEHWQRPAATLILSVSIRKRVMLLRRTSKKKAAWLRKELTSWGSVCAGRRMLVNCLASSSWTVRWLLPLATAGGRNTYCNRQARSWTWQTEMQNSTTVLLWEIERMQQQRRIRLYCAEPGDKIYTEARITL